MVHSKRSLEGYLLIDPGLGTPISAEEAAKSGLSVMGAGQRGVLEAGVITCAHCHKQMLITPMRTRDPPYCRKCDHYICTSPACNIDCTPLRSIMDEARRKELPLIIKG